MMDGRAYRFVTEQQLGRCLRVALPEPLVLSPDNGTDLPRLAIGASNLTILSADESPLWIDPGGALRRDMNCAGPLIGPAERIVFDRRQIWILTSESLHRIDGQTLQLVSTSDRGGIIDIAGDGAGGAWLLSVETIAHLDENGRRVPPSITLEAPSDFVAVAGETKALLTISANSLTLITEKKTGENNDKADCLVEALAKRKISVVEVPLADVIGDEGPFAAERLSSSRHGFLLEGQWDRQPGVLLLDANGDPSAWGVWEGDPPTIALAAGSDLYAFFAESGRLLRFSGAAEAGGTLWLTPALESDTLAGDWLRADVAAILPERATMTMCWASTTDEGLRNTAEAERDDERKPVGARVRTLQNILDWSSVARTYSGKPSEEDAPPEAESFAFPLHEAKGKGHVLWIELLIYGNRAETPPDLRSIIVHHDAPSLMDNLPAVYRGPDGDFDGLMWRMVAVLEATTQGLDERIGRLGDRLDPSRTEDRWLPGLASLLGLPFHASLKPEEQRRVLQKAPDILAGRGTRNGVIALLGALFPPGSFRVVDLTERLSPIIVGGGGLGGASLPGYLTGPSSKVPKLNARLILNRTSLCPTSPCDQLSVSRPPELLVEIATNPREQRRIAASVRHMIEAMLPAGVRLRLRWTTGTRGLGEPVTLTHDPKVMVLGEATPIRGIRIGGDRRQRLREGGIAVKHRLQ